MCHCYCYFLFLSCACLHSFPNYFYFCRGLLAVAFGILENKASDVCNTVILML